MNEKIKAHLIAYCESKGWETSDEGLMEVLKESKPLFKEIVGEHRWYEDEFRVVEINGMLIGFMDFHMTGDNNASDMGLEHDIRKVCEVEKNQKTIDYYERKS